MQIFEQLIKRFGAFLLKDLATLYKKEWTRVSKWDKLSALHPPRG